MIIFFATYKPISKEEKMETKYTTDKIFTCTIAAVICAALWFLVIPVFIALGLLVYVYKMMFENHKAANKSYTKMYEENRTLENELKESNTEEKKKEIESLNSEIEKLTEIHEKEVASNKEEIKQLNDEIAELKKSKELTAEKETKKIKRLRDLYKSMRYAINEFISNDNVITLDGELNTEFDEFELLHPSVMIKLHTMDVKALRKAYRENDKLITKILDQYSARYTTKANKAIYSLMTIALRSELQNILTKLKYDKLDSCIEDIKAISKKYLIIAGEGNQSIAKTMKKFIGEIEYLFINAAKIEYDYYVKKEKERQEQLAIREKMREEAAERKALEAEKKKVEAEESKFQQEIQKIKAQLTDAKSDEIDLLNRRILELQSQLSDVQLKKNDIVNLQNGKAGTVYVISNLGSFGEEVFKIGMTRRIDPQDRINELGSASVPFKFDVHSFIFSEDAVSLERKLHEILNEKRVNKVNLRKEFFRVTIDELEKLVQEIDPTAEFNRTMIASEYRASINSDVEYTDDNLEFDEDDLIME